MKEAYIDFPQYFLGHREKNIEESFKDKLLFSELEQLVNSGFQKHHICDEEKNAYDMAYECVQKLKVDCEKEEIPFQDIGAIIYSTCLPVNANIGKYEDFTKTRDIKHVITYPGSKLQADFNLEKSIVVGIDQQACTSMLGAIRLAKMFIQTETSLDYALCITADRFPHGAKYEQSYNLISDGAAAVLATSQKRGYRIIDVHQITNGAMAFATDDETVGHYFNYSKRLIEECLNRSQLSMSDIDYVIPQNTNIVAWQILCGLLPYQFENVLMETIAEVGHCISGDNIINLKHLHDQNKFKSGDKILMLMAGFGLNWQCLIMEKV